MTELIKYIIHFQAVIDAMNKNRAGKEKENAWIGF